MADHRIEPENQKRRLSFSSSPQNWDLGTTEIHPNKNKAALKRGRNSSLNFPYSSGKNLHVEKGHYYNINSSQSSQQQLDEDSLKNNSISITTNQDPSDRDAKVSALRCHSAPRKKKSFNSDIESNNVSQKLLGDSYELKNLFTTSDHIDNHLYEFLKNRLSSLFYPEHGAFTGPQSSLTIPQLIHRSIYQMEPNPVKNTFIDISIRHQSLRDPSIKSSPYSNIDPNTSTNYKSSNLSDDEIGEIIVAFITTFPDDMVSHQKILEALQKLNISGNNWSAGLGINMISIATDALNKFRHDQIIQYYFTSFLKQGMNHYLQETFTNSRIEDEIVLSLKINRLTCLDYSKCDELTQVFMDGLGCNLKNTIIFRKVYAKLQEKHLDQMMIAYQSCIDMKDVISDFLMFLDNSTGKPGIEEIAQAGGLQVLLKIADLCIDNVGIEIKVFQHMKNIMNTHEPSTKKCSIEPIVRVMSRNINSEKLIVQGCHILANFGEQKPGTELEVVELVLKSIVYHPRDKNVLWYACSTLSQIESPDNGFKVMFFLQELLESNKEDPELNYLILLAFAKITRKETHIDTFVQHIAVDDILAARLRHGEDGKLQEQLCYIIANMLKYHKIEKMDALSFTQYVVDIVKRFSDNSSCQGAAFITLFYLSNQFIEDVLVCDVAGFVIMGMISHTDTAKIQEYGCKILACLSSYTDTYQIGGIECILSALANHPDRKSVQGAAINTLCTFCKNANDETINIISTMQPLLEASQISFPHECTGMWINQIFHNIYISY